MCGIVGYVGDKGSVDIIIDTDEDLDFTVAAPQNYRLQLLHFSYGEASLLATKTAKNLAALVDAVS